MTSIAIADQSDMSLKFSISHSHLVAVVALRDEFISTFERSHKTCRMAANRWSALVADQNDCIGCRPKMLPCASFIKKYPPLSLKLFVFLLKSIMMDPAMRMILEQMQEDPRAAAE